MTARVRKVYLVEIECDEDDEEMEEEAIARVLRSGLDISCQVIDVKFEMEY